MAEIVKFSALHAIVGTWVSAERESYVEFTVDVSASGIAVSGRETIHGESLVIADVTFDGRILRFTSAMASDGRQTGHMFRLPSENGRLRHEVSLVETWVRQVNVDPDAAKSCPLEPNSTVDLLLWLQRWYAGQCDGDWEHGSGIKISTLDNPGWHLTVDISGTELEGMPFATREYQLHEDEDWWICEVKNGQFIARCSPQNLIIMIGVFRSWVERCRSSTAESR